MGHFAPDSNGLLAPIQPWLEDSEVSEILMNQPGEIYVENMENYKNIMCLSLINVLLCDCFN